MRECSRGPRRVHDVSRVLEEGGGRKGGRLGLVNSEEGTRKGSGVRMVQDGEDLGRPVPACARRELPDLDVQRRFVMGQGGMGQSGSSRWLVASDLGPKAPPECSEIEVHGRQCRRTLLRATKVADDGGNPNSPEVLPQAGHAKP